MTSYRYEVHITAWGSVEAPTKADAEQAAVEDAVDRVWDASPTIDYDVTLTEVPQDASLA